MIHLGRTVRKDELPLAIITDSLATADFDFDVATLAVGLAIDASREGFKVEVIVVADYDIVDRVPRTKELLAAFGVTLRVIVAEGSVQCKGAILAARLWYERYSLVVSTVPGLTAYLAEARRGVDTDGAIVNILCRPLSYSRRALGIFVDDPSGHAEQALLLRGLRATPLRFAAGAIAETFYIDNGLEFTSLDWIGIVARLAAVIEPRAAIKTRLEPSRAGSESPNTVSIMGNLDGRSGLEAIFDILLETGQLTEVALLGQPGQLPTDHALNVIAQFVTAYGGRTMLDFRTDIIRSLQSLRPGDLVASWTSDGLDCAAVLAVMLGLEFCGRLTGEVAAWLGSQSKGRLASNAHAFARMFKEAMCRTDAMELPAAEGVDVNWLDIAKPKAGKSPSHGRQPAIVRNSRPHIAPASCDVILLADAADDIGTGGDVRATLHALNLAGDVIVLAPKAANTGDFDVLRYDVDKGPGGHVVGLVHDCKKEQILLLRYNQGIALDSIAPLPVSESLSPCYIFPIVDHAAQRHSPPLTTPQLLRATSDIVFPLLLQGATIRQPDIIALTSLTIPGVMRELALRLLMSRGELLDLSWPVFNTGLSFNLVPSNSSLEIMDDARRLAAVAAESLPEELKDAVRLFQEPELRKFYPPPRFPRLLGDDWAKPELFRCWQGLGRSEVIIDGVAPLATGPRTIDSD